MNNKKSMSMLMNVVMYIVLILLVVVPTIYFVDRAGKQVSEFEQSHAKQIALILNKARPGMVIELDVSDLYQIARDNEYYGRKISLNDEGSRVLVILTSGKGYSIDHFNGDKVVWNIFENGDYEGREILHLEVIKDEQTG